MLKIEDSVIHILRHRHINNTYPYRNTNYVDNYILNSTMIDKKVEVDHTVY